MRILMIGDYKPQVGGPANVVQYIASYLSREHEVSVIYMEEPPYPQGLGHWFDGNVSVWQERLWFTGTQTVIQGAIQKTKRALLLRDQVDLYHAHGPFNALIGLLDRSKPLVLTFHGYPTLESLFVGTIRPNSLKFKIYRWIEKKTVNRADAIIVVGKKQKDWLVDELGAEVQKVFHVPNGVNVSEFYPTSPSELTKTVQKYALHGKKCLLFSKHFSPRYGAEYLVKALPIIVKVYPNTVCVMTNDDPWRESIISLAKDLGVYDHLVMPGRVGLDELLALYTICDVYVHPSINDQETFGIALIEAMAAGKPVIATAVGGPKEIIEGGDNVGILIPPKDPDAIASSVVEVLKNPVKYRNMGENARRYVLSTYTWESSYRETLRVYDYAKRKYHNLSR